jgi:biopolymer transport protein ExbB
MNLFYVFEHGDVVLVSTFMLLISMSLVSWYVIFWKAWVARKERANLEAFKAKYVTRPDWPLHVNIREAQGCVGMLIAEAERTGAILHEHEEVKRKELFTVHLSQGLDVIRVWLDKGLTLLASIGSSAPFIGLFGTVWGIYGALTDIATKGNASLNVVAGPMGEALIATAVGLFAAIPAVLAYNAFVRSNRILVQQLRHISEQLTLYLYEQGGTTKKQPVKLAAGAE